MHDGAADGHRSHRAPGPRPDRRGDSPSDQVGGRPDCDPGGRRTGDDLLRRAGQRRQRVFTYHQIADRLTYVVVSSLEKTDDNRHGQPPAAALLDPYDYDFHEDPYPYYKRLRDEAPLYHNAELGFWPCPGTATYCRASATPPRCPTAMACRSTPSRADRTLENHVVLSHGRPDHLRLRTLVSRVSRRAGSASWSTGNRTGGQASRRPHGAGGRRHGRLRRRVRGQAADGRHLRTHGVPQADRDRIRALADGVMHREDGVTTCRPRPSRRPST